MQKKGDVIDVKVEWVDFEEDEENTPTRGVVGQDLG